MLKNVQNFSFSIILFVNLNHVSVEPECWFFFVGERIMENCSDSGISESWSCVWRDKHFTTLRVQEHLCWRYWPLWDQRRDLWCFVFGVLDSYIGAFGEVCVHSAESWWQWWRWHVCTVLFAVPPCQSWFVA